MKKVLFLLSVVALFTTSCEGPPGRDGFDGEDGQDFEFYVENFRVRSQDWEFVNSGRYTSLFQYVVDVDVQEEAYEFGIVQVYLFQINASSNSEVQTPLPYWIQYTSGDNTWLEGFNYDFDQGTVAFYAEVANGTRPADSNFRVVVAP
ncbi:MAG: hypothetical protein LBE91_19920 [Tannerella sp.]|jgi:hypothetical protein|nr:hypothetical protein [Tannerella sp.]